MYLIQLLACLLAFQLTVGSALKPASTESTLASNGEAIPLYDEEAQLTYAELDAADHRRHEPLATTSSVRPYPGASRSVYTAPLLGCNPMTQVLTPGVYRYESPNYKRENGGNYPNNFNCTYSFLPADPMGKLRFDCFFFQLENSNCCSKDVFEINGKDRYCGKNMPTSFLADSLNIRFSTDSSGTDKGFFCTVMSKESGAGCGGLPCGKRYVKPGTYTILSKNHPDNYDVNQYCKWELVAINPSDTLELSCSSFDMISWDGFCEWDWMKVNGKRYCNTNKPPSSIMSKSAITVEYSTPDTYKKVRKGFKCTVTVKDGK